MVVGLVRGRVNLCAGVGGLYFDGYLPTYTDRQAIINRGTYDS